MKIRVRAWCNTVLEAVPLFAGATSPPLTSLAACSVVFCWAQLRADGAVCQAASALVASFVSNIRAALHVQRRATMAGITAGAPVAPAWSYLSQLESLGFMFMWESLLSTVGNEYGMLDDMHVAVQVRCRCCVCSACRRARHHFIVRCVTGDVAVLVRASGRVLGVWWRGTTRRRHKRTDAVRLSL